MLLALRIANLAVIDEVEVAFEKIFEVKMAFSILGVAADERISLQVSVWQDGLPLQILPQEGWLPLELTEDLTVW